MPFTHIDPDTGHVPLEPVPLLSDMVARARKILGGRDLNAIDEIAGFAEYLIEGYFAGEEQYFIERQLNANGWILRYLPADQHTKEGIANFIKEGPPCELQNDEEFDYPSRWDISDVAALKKSLELFMSCGIGLTYQANECLAARRWVSSVESSID